MFGCVHSWVLVRTAHCCFSLIVLLLLEVNISFMCAPAFFLSSWLLLVPASLWPLGPYLTAVNRSVPTKSCIPGRARHLSKYFIYTHKFTKTLRRFCDSNPVQLRINFITSVVCRIWTQNLENVVQCTTAWANTVGSCWILSCIGCLAVHCLGDPMRLDRTVWKSLRASCQVSQFTIIEVGEVQRGQWMELFEDLPG